MHSFHGWLVTGKFAFDYSNSVSPCSVAAVDSRAQRDQFLEKIQPKANAHQ